MKKLTEVKVSSYVKDDGTKVKRHTRNQRTRPNKLVPPAPRGQYVHHNFPDRVKYKNRWYQRSHFETNDLATISKVVKKANEKGNFHVIIVEVENPKRGKYRSYRRKIKKK